MPNPPGYNIIPNDWISLEYMINDLCTRVIKDDITQSLGTTASPQFAGLTLSDLATGFVKSNSGVLSSGAITADELPAHALVGSVHSASGLTAGHVLTASGATTYGFAALPSYVPAGDALLLDQTTPQTMINGSPSFSSGLKITGNAKFSLFQGSASQSADATYTLPVSSASGLLRNTSGVLSWDNTAYQPLATNLTSLAGLTFASSSFVKMTAAGTFGLDTASYQPAGTYVTSVSGTSPISSSGGTTPAISIADASTSSKGAASFSSTNFTVTSGAVNTIQDISAAASPTFVDLNVNSINMTDGYDDWTLDYTEWAQLDGQDQQVSSFSTPHFAEVRIGYPRAQSAGFGGLVVAGTNQCVIERSANDTLPATMVYARSRGTTLSPTMLNANDVVGALLYRAFVTGDAGTYSATVSTLRTIVLARPSGTTYQGQTQLFVANTVGTISQIVSWDFTSGMVLSDAVNLGAGTTTGTRIGTATNQRIGFWNTTPIVQPTTSVASATFAQNSGNAINDASTFDGYTISKVVKALRNMGLLA